MVYAQFSSTHMRMPNSNTKKREAPSCSLIERLVVCPDFQKLLEKDRAIGMPTRSLSNYSSCSDPFVLCPIAAFPNRHTFHLAKSPITHHRLYIGDEECMPWAIAQAMKERWGAVTFPKPERPIRKWLCELADGHARDVRWPGGYRYVRVADGSATAKIGLAP